MKRRNRIVLIDSGVKTNCVDFADKRVHHIDLGLFDDYDVDNLGHGTAIAYILTRDVDYDLYSIKIMDNKRRSTEKDLVRALKYVYDKMDVDFIHISSGVMIMDRESELENICLDLRNKGVNIVAAYANHGVKSYPAAFDCVIGVYWSTLCLNVNEYIYNDNSYVNVCSYAGKLLLPRHRENYDYVSGSSYSSAYITLKLAKEKEKLGFIDFDCLNYLMANAKHVNHFDTIDYDFQKDNRDFVTEIDKAIVFPINKEVHAILGNQDLLPFNLVGVYDVKYSGHVGESVNDIVYSNRKVEGVVEDYESIDWNSDFDTVIVGHTVYLDQIMRFSLLEYFIDKCITYKKNLYCFDPVDMYKEKTAKIVENGNRLVDLCIDNIKMVDNSFGSLNKFDAPIIGVVGTNSKQGKYNIQLELRRNFLKNDFTVGQVGTEPTSYLFGFDIAYPVGFNSAGHKMAHDEVYYLNHEIKKLDQKDVIVLGTQSQTVPYQFGNVYFYPLAQHNLLLATQPDVFILAIDYYDNFGYIKRTVDYLETYYGAKVVAFVVFPIEKNYSHDVKGAIGQRVKKEDLESYCKRIEDFFNTPTYINGDNMSELYDSIVSYLQGE